MSTIEILDTGTEPVIANQCPTNEIAVANWFLARAAEEGMELAPQVLQTLVQLAYGWYFVAYRDQLFMAVPVVQPQGPVLPSLDAFYPKPSSKVRVFQDDKVEVVDYQIELPESELSKLSDTDRQQYLRTVERIKMVLDVVWQKYKNIPAKELVMYLQLKGTPWDRIVVQAGRDCLGVFIGHKAIQNYFLEFHEQAQKYQAENQKNNE
ncbi:MAG: DUF4065 domain-containing protein [Planctomycetaceae bacterium]|jgi:uncharacterized phage-associated protein|nr:DUF4065 domain-containing protein [Planctomycetaceae bacterium]